MTKILLDVDTGTDDALAILYAVAHPDLEIAGITCVAGNSGLGQVVSNTHKVLDAAKAGPISVAAGASRPLIERARQERHFHGVDGLGGVVLPDTARTVAEHSAVGLMHAVIGAASDPVTIVSLAPKTNLALLLTIHPDDAEGIERIVFMGGSASIGNVTAVAEFNVWQDPEAADCVLESGIPVTMYGLDVFNRLLVGRDAADRYRAHDSAALRLAGELLHRRSSRADGTADDYLGQIGDAGALVCLTDPDLFDIRRLPVRMNLAGIGRGQTIVDQRGVAPDAAALARDPWPQLDVVLDGDLEDAAARFVAVVDSYVGRSGRAA